MEFKEFRNLLKQNIEFLSKQSVCLFKLDVDKETLWDTYIESYRTEDNPIVKENRHYDCNCCKSFIRRFSNVCGIVDGKLYTIWDIPTTIPQPYDVVVEAMQNLLANKPIVNKFLYDEKSMGTEYNLGTTPDKLGNRYEHFYANTPACAYTVDIDTKLGEFQQTHQVIKRSLEELSIDAVNLVLDIVYEGNLARGEQMKPQLEKFQQVYQQWQSSTNKDLFIWEVAQTHGRSVAIRNTAIGTLLINLSEGMDVSEAIFKYNNIVDPTNYKRVIPVFTEKQRQDASNMLKGLGYDESLQCRHAKLSDISITNVFWANRKSKSIMQNDPLDFLKGAVQNGNGKKDEGSTISIEEFMNLLSTTSKLEIYLDNSHEKNLMNLLVQNNMEAPSLLNWANPFRWSYKGDLTGASKIKEAVKLAGGNVEGVLNFRLAWNESGTDTSDLDAWATEPSGNRIGYSTNFRKDRGGQFSLNQGQLDVDNTNPGNKMGVENITWKVATKGTYKLWVNQYSARNSQGFTAEVEFAGETHTFQYKKPVNGNVVVAEVTYDGNKWTIKSNLSSEQSSKALWQLDTKKYYEVSTFMLSPNYWNNKVGNPHYFFFVEGLHNPDSCRSLYNEYLKPELLQHKRVFEMLGSKLRVEPEPNQMAGLGFTIDEQHKLQVRLDGRPYQINFTGKLVNSQVEKQIPITI